MTSRSMFTSIQRALRDPRHRVAGVLGAVLLLTGIPTGSLTVPLILVVITAGLDWLVSRIRGRGGFPSSALVTGLLLALIASPRSPWYLVGGIAVLAISAKYLLRFRGRHIFNPAGFGLVSAGFLVGPTASWWGVYGSPWTPWLLAVGMGLGLWRLRRLSISVLFFSGYFLVLTLLHQSLVTATRLVFDPTVLLFGLVMVPEPMTSPVRAPWLWIYEFALIGSLVIQLVFKIALPDVLLGSLLIANLAYRLSYRPTRVAPGFVGNS